MFVRRGIRFAACALLACAIVLGAGAAWAQEAADSSAAPAAGLRYSLEATSSFHHVDNAYFDAPDWQASPDPRRSDYSWSEGFTRARVGYRLANGLSGGVGGVLLGTRGIDYFGARDEGDAMLDQLFVAAEDVGGTGLSLTVGRQSLEVGDGFVIGDGYLDTRAGLWNIPLSFYDAARLDWGRGPFTALAFVSRLSPSFGVEVADPGDEAATVTLEPEGTVSGGEVAWSFAEERTLALGYFLRDDRGDTRLDARAASLRGVLAAGPLTFNGEFVLERGTFADADLRAHGGRLCATAKLPGKGEPFVELEHLRFSGDDPETPEDEQYYPWQFTWSDWSRWYVADLLGSTLMTNCDSRVWRLACGVTPLEDTSVRLMLHRLDLDTGSCYGGMPEAGRGFADEADLIVEQGLGDRWSAWVMGAHVRPRDAGKALVGSGSSWQLFASVTFKLSSPAEEE